MSDENMRGLRSASEDDTSTNLQGGEHSQADGTDQASPCPPRPQLSLSSWDSGLVPSASCPQDLTLKGRAGLAPRALLRPHRSWHVARAQPLPPGPPQQPLSQHCGVWIE